MIKSESHPHPEALYYHIARDTLQAAQKDSDEFQKAQLVTTSIIFSTLCLEAFINQEYEIHKKTKSLLDEDNRISHALKWLMLPLLLGYSKTFDKDKQPFQYFQELINIRNQRLVHFKPKKEIRQSGKDNKKEYFGGLVKNITKAEKYFICIEKMIKELNRLTKGKTSVPKFIQGDRYISKSCMERGIIIKGK